ncbi:hypothetical protein CONPUDRAFT_72342 [Coniophora puteana RWD-64-598 SS2]|uniref:Uncharacterized protein n=1 Tax=Coniophora puteana (strain RWD-64-598) TaxID=741705 RepID=A0A5M3MS80_CONPW|nr:uncharacterized protein CONPUDRAFT_72342 [Coniophora puteana RWD-64-598 SS2]EIW82003.1 hypothetical protein CONPUDRAFT_72342 [Coniophora puteana RWD-64-598 SS2]
MEAKEKDIYNMILQTLRTEMHHLGFDLKVKYKVQPHKKLGKLFKIVCCIHKADLYEQYDFDWPLAEIVKQYLQNSWKPQTCKHKAEAKINNERMHTCTHIDELEDSKTAGVNEGLNNSSSKGEGKGKGKDKGKGKGKESMGMDRD